PEWGCISFKLLYDYLHDLEKDLFIHIHKENNILFPRY
ncbi:MAG: iron-sulfur cluster repair di-iron protein, partial [Clostridium perfringens]|nr:iron-sulfur cluster repair di-iron protein [Clostridium perfringens]